MMIVVLTTLSAIGPLATDMYIPAFPQVEQDLATTAARMQLTLTAFFVGTASGQVRGPATTCPLAFFVGTASGQVVAGPLSGRMGRRAPRLFGIGLWRRG